MRKCILAFTLLICLLLCGCSQKTNSIVGEWVIDSYLFENEVVSPDKIGELFGLNFERIQNDRTFIFFNDGTFAMKWPEYGYGEDMENVIGNYTIAGSTVKLTVDDSSKLLRLEDGRLILEDTNIVARYKLK